MGKKILLVEDEPAVSRIHREAVVCYEFETDIATTQMAAKDMLVKENYDLCLIDIRTPGMSGMELYHYLKEEHPELAIKVMITIGDVLSGNVDSFFGEFNRPFLPNPFTLDELRAIVRQASSQEKKNDGQG